MNTKIIIATISVILFGSIVWFYASSTLTANSKVQPVVVGNDIDDHGCKPSTGYIYSKLKNTCIRVFESGIRLDPQAENLDKTLSAFAVFQSEIGEGQVEIFLPGSSDTIILPKLPDNGAGLWGDAKYEFSHWKGMYTLTDTNSRVLYQGQANLGEIAK